MNPIMKLTKARTIVLSVIFSSVMAAGVAVLAYNPSTWFTVENQPLQALPEPVAEMIQAVESLPVFEEEIDESKPKGVPSASEEAVEKLRELDEKVTAVWGENEKVLPSTTDVVKYSEDLHSRSIIDLKDGKLIVQTIGTDEQADIALKNALIAALLTPGDPRQVDLLSFKPNPHPLPTEHPFLFGQIEDNRGRPIEDLARAETFAKWALKRKLRIVASTLGPMKQISLPLNAHHRMVRADRFAKIIESAAVRYQQDPALLYAIAETESHFNPYAISAEGAMGLMQIVSSSAGIDAMHAMGKYRAPTKDELYDPATNAQLGAKYVQLLRDRYLAGIQHPDTREVAAISAYNSGANSTLKTFAKKQTQALETINALTPQEVYDTLKTKHRSPETRAYLQKVTSARGRYLNKEKEVATSS